MITLDTEKVSDSSVREQLEKLSELLNSLPLVRGDFHFATYPLTKTGTVLKFRHGRTYVPNAIYLVWVSDGASVDIKYDQIDATYVAFQTDRACEIRVLMGRIGTGA